MKPQSFQFPSSRLKRVLTIIQKIQTTTSSNARWKFPQNVSSQTLLSSMPLLILNIIKRATIIPKSQLWAVVLAFSLPSSQNLTASSLVVATTHSPQSTLFVLASNTVSPSKNAKKLTGLVFIKSLMISWISAETSSSNVTSSKPTSMFATSHSSWAKVTGLVAKNSSQTTPYVKLLNMAHSPLVSSVLPKLSSL